MKTDGGKFKAKVVSIDINGELLRKEMAALDSDNILTIEMDVVDEAAWKDAIKQTMERFGKLDILVNNAAQLYHIEYKSVGAGRASRHRKPRTARHSQCRYHRHRTSSNRLCMGRTQPTVLGREQAHQPHPFQ